MLASITTPDRVETSRLGTLEFDDGAPTPDTAQRLSDHLDFMRGIEAFLSSYQGASLIAARQGFLSAGVEDNQVLLIPELMDAASLFLTPNSDTVYFWSFVDLTQGLVPDPALLQPAAAVLPQELAAERDRTPMTRLQRTHRQSRGLRHRPHGSARREGRSCKAHRSEEKRRP
jgi:hypothetical protein